MAYQDETARLLDANRLGPEAEAVMTGVGTSKKVSEGGCWSEARREVYGTLDPVFTLANDLSNEAYTAAGKSGPVRSVFRSWSRCMAENGYHYDAPLDAPGDPRFAAPEASGEEIATALADLDCRARHRVADVWYAEESKLQEKAVKQHATELEKDRDILEAAAGVTPRCADNAS